MNTNIAIELQKMTVNRLTTNTGSPAVPERRKLGPKLKILYYRPSNSPNNCGEWRQKQHEQVA